MLRNRTTTERRAQKFSCIQKDHSDRKCLCVEWTTPTV